MEATFQKIKQVYAEADLNGRMEIQGFIRELQVGFYSDWDVVMRLASGVSMHVSFGTYPMGQTVTEANRGIAAATLTCENRY